MKNKKSGNKIYPIKWSPVSHDTHFVGFFFEHTLQYYQFKRTHAGIIQTERITLTPVVDHQGNLFNPVTPVVFYLN